ncbi:MAG: hypothetical protein K1X74_15890 [Pirellulales bacterium]|nr:hypothetical protein [Pirellulales bacterium]
MKTTIRSLAATAVVCCAAPVLAQTQSTWIVWELGRVACAQNQPDEDLGAADPRGEALALLKQARDEMKAGRLDEAEQLLERAESLNVKFSLLQSLSDTPKKVRRDLDKLRASKRKQAKLPSARIQPNAEDEAPASNPNPGATNSALQSDAALDAVTGKMKDRKGTAVLVLQQAREALDAGNVPAAVHYYRELLKLGVQFGPDDADSVEKLAADIKAAGGRLDSPQNAPTLNPLGQTDAVDPNLLPDEGHPLGPAATAGMPERLPQVADEPGAASFPRTSPFGTEVTTEPPVDPNDGLALPGRVQPEAPAPLANARAESDKLLVAARQALAVGDLARARRAAEQAQSLGVEYGYHEDQPSKVAAAIEKYQLLLANRAQHGQTEGYRRQYAQVLLEQAMALIAWGQWDTAERLAVDADRLQANFAPFEMTPQKVLAQISDARQKQGLPPTQAPAQMAGGNAAAVQQAVAEMPATAAQPGADAAVYQPELDHTRNVATNDEQLPFEEPASGPSAPELSVPLGQSDANPLAGEPAATTDAPPQTPVPENPDGKTFVVWGEKALAGGDLVQARAYLQEANARRAELDPAHLLKLDQLLRQVQPSPGEVSQTAQPGSLLPDASAEQKVLANKVAVELTRREAAARQLAEQDPQAALAKLQETRKLVEDAGLDSAARDILLRRVDRTINELQQYIDKNRPLVELKQKNQAVEAQIDRERQAKLDGQEKLAELVEEFNTLQDEERFAEAIVVARRAVELMPDEPVAQQLMVQANFLHRHRMSLQVRDEKENGFVNALASTEESSTPFDDRNPLVFRDAKEWEALTNRRRSMQVDGPRRSEKELEIEQKLRTPVSLGFTDAPLSEVMEYLGKVAELNIYLDPQGLAEEGITTGDKVTINLTQDIQLKSALRLILEPKRLAYVIKDEVLKITSIQLKDTELITRTYGVADLVVPIPHFLPSNDMGMAGALRDAYGNVGFGAAASTGGSAPLMVAATQGGGTTSATLDPRVMAQMNSPIGGGNPAATGSPQNFGFGPGGAGGGTQADFDSLIELITSTVAPTTWDEVGGPGSVKQFDTNLSLVISQTQEVHEQIVDLLEQLRRLQDLQVTIEVRFITLNDNFFERIGIDFDFDLNDKIDRPFQVWGKPLNPQLRNDDAITTERNLRDRDYAPTITVGQAAPGVFSTDLDIPFRQDSFTLAVPQFGGFDAAAGASLGFAILSDIEAFFFINAAQGDRRSNVLQAPKVTLFNGQTATVSDISQSPFVISVIPVVGDFAAAQQPVIVVLSEGTFLTVQAVVTSDRRFVRLTVVPFFSQIGEVDTFTFSGSTTTSEESASTGPDEDPTSESSAKTTVTEGTSVQLPTFSFVSVSTTVSVPDGGTVLLGGIKRLSEGRNEFGVPMLNKLPYINRLFKNVGIGRETQSLMMMVTPRIIIQEEEEALLGISPAEAP